MDVNKKVLVTGGSGLVGMAIKNILPTAEYISSTDYNLIYHDEVENMFMKHKPTHVIHLAGMVGGVGANTKYPVEFFENNILINTLILKYAHKYNVQKLVAFMSTCVFPDNIEYPLQPHKIHNGEPHFSNFGYAYAKRMIEIQLRAYQTEYNYDWFSVIPTNIYGPNDNFNLEMAHVVPALIHKCYLAKQNNTPLVIWGSGEPTREFIYVDDVAQLTLNLLENYKGKSPIILSTPEQITIRTLVELIAKNMNFSGKIIFDKDKPTGQQRKPSDTKPLKIIFPKHNFISIEDGVKRTINWFMENHDHARR